MTNKRLEELLNYFSRLQELGRWAHELDRPSDKALLYQLREEVHRDIDRALDRVT